MELILKKEFKEIIDLLDDLKSSIIHNEYKHKLQEVIYKLKHLGSVPELNHDAQQFITITNEMSKIFVQKNHDYGNSFEESLNEEGIVAARIRLGDKWRRFVKLSKNIQPQVNDEKIEDTLLDMSNYCIMLRMWLDKQNKNDE